MAAARLPLWHRGQIRCELPNLRRNQSLPDSAAAAMQFIALPKSSFLDYSGYRLTTERTVEAAYRIDDARPFDAARDQGFNLGIMLRRVQDPSPLLAGNWGERQQALRQLRDSDTLWSTYGADPSTYNQLVEALDRAGIPRLTSQDSNYVSGPASRMVWVAITSAEQFRTLFDTELLYSPSQGLAFWNGDLSLPADWADRVEGLWLDVNTAPPASNQTPGVAVTLPEGPQSQGSSAKDPSLLPPQQIAALYNFPLQGQAVRTGTIGLVEPAVGTYLPGDPSGHHFESRLDHYLVSINQTRLPGGGGVVVQGVDGQSRAGSSGSGIERSLDVGVAAAVNPNSLLALYNGSGESKAVGNAQATVFTAAQSAIWDLLNDPGVVSNSYGDLQSMTPGSPFYRAYGEMFLDAVLRNQTTVIALGDGGSGNQDSNGLTNVETNITQPWNLLVGGTSLSSLKAAESDETLKKPYNGAPSLLGQALAGDRSTLWALIRSGLSQMPSLEAPDQWLLETVWNDYQVKDGVINGLKAAGQQGYLINSTSSGGVDPTQPVPSYQQRYGLAPLTGDPFAQPGRGVPDVALNAGGNLLYMVPSPDLQNLFNDYGTSAAAPMWASLLIQINTIFADQGLPRLGYLNDLLYTVAVVSPGAFNDVMIGENTSSFTRPGPYSTPDGHGKLRPVQPTGFGYEAGPDYDLITGLGSPNGTLLAIALTNLAHGQLSSERQPDVLVGDPSQGLASGVRQSLLWQVNSPVEASVALNIDREATVLNSPAAAPYAWTSRLAQQSLQESFDPALLMMFDGQAQGALRQTDVAAGASLAVSIDASLAATPQLELSNAWGFVDFATGTGSVRAARAVCVATTPGDADESPVVVRMRQNGVDDQALFFYRVDDLTGTIAGIAPGDAAYGDAAMQRRYGFSDGQQILEGGGYGNYSQGVLMDVNAGDVIAMGLINQSTSQIYWGFSEANERQAGSGVTHLWNYGHNTFGFEDTFLGGDRDFQDSVFQLDFASATGSQYLL